MARPRLRRKHRAARLTVPASSLMPLWSLAGGCDVEDEDELDAAVPLARSA